MRWNLSQATSHGLVFWVFNLTIITVVIFLTGIFIPAFVDQGVFSDFIGVTFLLGGAISFLLFGLLLVYLTISRNIEQPLHKYLILTGLAAVGVVLFSILHNVFYALATMTSDYILPTYFFEFLDAVSFLISLIVCPIAFIVGSVRGYIYLGINDK